MHFAKLKKMSVQEAKKIRSDDLLVIATGKQKYISEESITSADGSIKWYQTTKIPVTQNNKRDYILGVYVDISERKNNLDLLKKREAELNIKNQTLEELNTALEVLLRQKDDNRIKLEKKVLATVGTRVDPYLNKLNILCQDSMRQNIIRIIKTNLNEIISPFSSKLSSGFVNLTNAEIRRCDHIKNGYSNKEIADLLNIANDTVAAHRKNIRKKLGIKNSKTNLSSYLRNIA